MLKNKKLYVLLSYFLFVLKPKINLSSLKKLILNELKETLFSLKSSNYELRNSKMLLNYLN